MGHLWDASDEAEFKALELRLLLALNKLQALNWRYDFQRQQRQEMYRKQGRCISCGWKLPERYCNVRCPICLQEREKGN